MRQNTSPATTRTTLRKQPFGETLLCPGPPWRTIVIESLILGVRDVRTNRLQSSNQTPCLFDRRRLIRIAVKDPDGKVGQLDRVRRIAADTNMYELS